MYTYKNPYIAIILKFSNFLLSELMADIPTCMIIIELHSCISWLPFQYLKYHHLSTYLAHLFQLIGNIQPYFVSFLLLLPTNRSLFASYRLIRALVEMRLQSIAVLSSKDGSTSDWGCRKDKRESRKKRNKGKDVTTKSRNY
jgi:hypothetical protein